MTFDEALKEAKLRLQNVEQEYPFYNSTLLEETRVWLATVVKSLEKQVSQTVRHNATELMCPRCNRTFNIDEIEMPYCWHCGQKLNWYWSDEE